LHMAQLIPLPLTVSCFSKIQIGFTFLVPAYPESPEKGPLNRCVYSACKFNSVTLVWCGCSGVVVLVWCGCSGVVVLVWCGWSLDEGWQLWTSIYTDLLISVAVSALTERMTQLDFGDINVCDLRVIKLTVKPTQLILHLPHSTVAVKGASSHRTLLLDRLGHAH